MESDGIIRLNGFDLSAIVAYLNGQLKPTA
jgi:hypothetical protein